MGYGNLMESRFCELIASGLVGDYRGNEHFVVKQQIGWAGNNKFRYGFSSAGYGSCFYCDVLESIKDDGKALNELAEEIYRGIRWFDSKEKLVEFLQSADKANNWYANEEQWPELVEQFAKALTTEVSSDDATEG